MQIWLFDIDGTLIDSAGSGRAAMLDTLAVEFGARGDAEHVPFAGRTDHVIIRDLLAAHQLEMTTEVSTRFRQAYARRLPDELHRRRGRVLPGVEALLASLRRQPQTHTGLLTGNLAETAGQKLKHYRLHTYFDFGGFGDRHEDRNDVAAEALAAARKHVGQPLDDCQVWVVGDTPHDVRCGRAIGAKVVAVATGHYSRPELDRARPDVLLDDLSEIEKRQDLPPWSGRIDASQ